MTMKEVAYMIEELQVKVEKADSFQLALFEAIYRGDNAVETYEGAFCALGDLTFSIKKDIAELKKSAFNSFKKEGSAI